MDNEKYIAIEEPTEPCKSCSRASWNELYGVLVFCCDMSHCIADSDSYYDLL